MRDGRITQELWAEWDCADPMRECRECGELYSEYDPEFRPDAKTGCPYCHAPTIEERLKELEDTIERWKRVGCDREMLRVRYQRLMEEYVPFLLSVVGGESNE